MPTTLHISTIVFNYTLTLVGMIFYTHNSLLFQDRKVPESHCPEEIEDLRQWSLMGDGVRTRVHIVRYILIMGI